MNTVTEVAQDVKKLGVSIGLMLHELDLPQHVKDMLLSFLEILEPEQMVQFAEMLEVAVARQLTVEEDAGYQSAAMAADQEMVEQLDQLIKEYA